MQGQHCCVDAAVLVLRSSALDSTQTAGVTPRLALAQEYGELKLCIRSNRKAGPNV